MYSHLLYINYHKKNIIPYITQYYQVININDYIGKKVLKESKKG